MKHTLQTIFKEYSYLADKDILENLLKNVDDKTLKEIKGLEDLKPFFLN